MVIIGAGASYDSVHFRPIEEYTIHSWPYRPPLANEAFDDRTHFGTAIDAFPQCRPLAQRLRQLPDEKSLEAELDGLFAEATDYAPLRRQFAALRFYLQRVLVVCGREWLSQANYVTNYVGLLDTVDKWRTKRKIEVCFVSFNYDLMLEAAFSEIGLHLNAFDAYVGSPYRLIKPHGSVNWARKASGLSYEQSKPVEQLIIEQVDQLNISKDFVHLGGALNAGSAGEPL